MANCGFSNSSNTTWALVPLNPKELIPHLRSPLGLSHSLSLSFKYTGEFTKSIKELGYSIFKLGGSIFFSRDSAAFINDMIPAPPII